MRTSLKLLASTLMVCSLAACVANAPKQSSDSRRAENQASFDTPDWVNNPPQRSGFAYGIGSGDLWGDKADAARRAGDAARVNLVSQLRVTVSGDFSSSVQERKATGKQTELVQTVQNTIRSKVPAVELDEVKVTETFFEKKFAYALAELDRVKAASRLRAQIADLEVQVTTINSKPRSGTSLQKLRILLPALKLFAQRDRLADQLALVGTQRQKPALSNELQQIQDNIYALFNQLRVRISMTDTGAQEIAAGVMEALTEQGMRINNSGDYDLMIQVSAKLRPVEKNGSHFVFADSRVTIKDADDRTLSTFSKQAKGASGYPDLAKAKAERSVANVLAAELAAALVDKIN
ncbi:MAG: hypothetical protein V7765_16035 [Oleispira sp.]